MVTPFFIPNRKKNPLRIDNIKGDFFEKKTVNLHTLHTE
jgi:hypothetical protein